MHRTGIWLAALLLTVFAITAMAPVTLIAQSQDLEQPSAQTLLDMAMSRAAIDDRNVMVRFRASWCEWCARLKAALHSFELGRIIADNYVLVSLTVQESDDKAALETPGAQTFMDTTGGGQAGLPFYLFMDSEGALIANSMVMPGGGNIG